MKLLYFYYWKFKKYWTQEYERSKIGILGCNCMDIDGAYFSMIFLTCNSISVHYSTNYKKIGKIYWACYTQSRRCHHCHEFCTHTAWVRYPLWLGMEETNTLSLELFQIHQKVGLVVERVKKEWQELLNLHIDLHILATDLNVTYPMRATITRSWLETALKY